MFQPFVWQKVAPVLQKSLYPNYFVIFAVLNHSDKKLTMISLFQSDDVRMMDEKVVFLLHSECITSEQTEYLNMNIMHLSIKILFSDGSILSFSPQILGAGHSKFSIGQPLEVNGLKFQNHGCYS